MRTEQTRAKLWLRRIKKMPSYEGVKSYPESSMPQNDLDLVTSAGKESTFIFRPLEAQLGN